MALLKRKAYETNETPPAPAEEDIPLIDKMLAALRERGFKVKMDEDHDPCFLVSETEFEAMAGTSYYTDLLKDLGYTASYQVRAVRETQTTI